MSDVLHFGTVCWFNVKKGYGFISWDIDGVQQKDLFVHFSDINCPGFKNLNKDDKVSFGLGVNKSGDPKAVSVTVLKN